MNHLIAQNKQATAHLFNVASFLNSLASGVTGPLMIVYLLFLRLSPAQIGVLLATGRLAMIVFEFPTGVLADRYGRKKSLLVSFALSSLLLIGWFVSVSFNHLFIIFILSGLAYTFQSGAKEALMIDVLQLGHHDNLRNKVFVRIGSWGNLGFVVGGILAALLSFFSLRSIWFVAALCNVALFTLFFFGVKEERIPNVDTNDDTLRVQKRKIHSLYISSFIALSKDTLHSLLASKPLLRLLSITVLFSLATAVYGLAYPIYFKQIIALPDYMFGVLGSVSALVGIAGMIIGEKICEKRGQAFTLRFFMIALALLFIILGESKTIAITIFIFIIIETLIHGWFPIYQSLFNKFITERVRASILSLQSVITLLAIGTGEVVTGGLLSVLSPAAVIQYSSLLLLIAVLFLTTKRPQTQ